MAKIIQPDGSFEERTLPDYKLETMQALVGGLIEFVSFEDGSAIMVHEEGKLIGLPLNASATALMYVKKGHTALSYEKALWGQADVLVGPAVFFSAEEMRAMDSEEDS